MKKFDFYCEEVFSGKAKIETLYESDTVTAYFHTKPFYEFHVVVVPREHISDLTQVGNEHKELMWEIMKVARDIMEDYASEREGLRLITNFGKYQDTPHLHFHVVSGKKIR